MAGLVRWSEGEAAAAVNFRLLRPTLEGVRYDPAALSVRVEGPPYALHPDPAGTVWSRWAGLHGWSAASRLETPHGALRCKQFLYDLGPLPTLDHAALYDHRPELMRVHALDAERVAWTGYDYADRPALTMLAWGTSLELRELDGGDRSHPDSFLLDLARSFRPVRDEPLPPLAARSYWSRYPRYDLHLCRLRSYRPPSSLWRWRWPWLARGHRWQTGLPVTSLPGLARQGSEVFAPAWRFDSACVIGEPAGPDPCEVQLFFQPASGRGHAQLWLRWFRRAASPLREPGPGEWPDLDSHSGFRGFHRTRWTAGGGARGFLASRTLAHGPHDALWWQGEHGYVLQVSAAVRHDLRAALELVGRAVGEPVAAAGQEEGESGKAAGLPTAGPAGDGGGNDRGPTRAPA